MSVTDEQITQAQGFLKTWREFTSLPMASHVVDFARAIQEEAYKAGMAAAVPDGWKAVPVEPTEDMLINIDEDVGGHCYSCTRWRASWDDCRRVWSAMLSASPEVK